MIRVEKIKEIQDNVNNSKKINLRLHNEVIKTEMFSIFSSKLRTNTYQKSFNKIFWLSYMGHMISFSSIFEHCSAGDTIKYNVMDLRLFHPLMEIFEEICNMTTSKTVYHSLFSNLMRQLIELIILNKELDENKIEEKIIFEAAIASYNKQINCDTSIFKNLNIKNSGLFKVFKNRVYLKDLVKKYHYKTGYRIFSGDIHSPASIEKLYPDNRQSKSRFNEIYLGMGISLITEVLEYLISKVDDIKGYKLDIRNNFTVH